MFIPKWRLTLEFSRSSGPGGQHVNKTESRVSLRFHVESADWIPTPVRERFARQQSSRINKVGEFLLHCEDSRSQKQNLDTALERLDELLTQAEKVPKKRIATKASRGSQRRRLEGKKLHSLKKKDRKVEF